MILRGARIRFPVMAPALVSQDGFGRVTRNPV